MTVFSDCAAARVWRWFRENGDMLYRNSVLGRIGVFPGPGGLC